MADESESYATWDDYKANFPNTPDSDESAVEPLLEKASARLVELVAEYGIDEKAKSAALEEVCCNMVNRRMRAGASAPLSSVTHQANGFSETYSYATSTRVGWQLYPEDYERLGIAQGGVACVSPWRKP